MRREAGGMREGSKSEAGRSSGGGGGKKKKVPPASGSGRFPPSGWPQAAVDHA